MVVSFRVESPTILWSEKLTPVRVLLQATTKLLIRVLPLTFSIPVLPVIWPSTVYMTGRPLWPVLLSLVPEVLKPVPSYLLLKPRRRHLLPIIFLATPWVKLLVMGTQTPQVETVKALTTNDRTSR